MVSKKILITADDFGMCQAVDNAIINLIEAGSITTTNVLVNMETVENAKLLRRNYPDISIGIHWNVTTGKPVSDIRKVKTLVNECGEFYSIGQFKKNLSAQVLGAPFAIGIVVVQIVVRRRRRRGSS
jgi:predicted glycoside hydrolase/deacetylase ChbG (UPF0249 family)